MNYQLIVKPEAELDLQEAAVWYEDQKPGLGLRFLYAGEEKLNLILLHPFNYQLRYKSIRFALVKTFPFAIHFMIEEENIIILAILSTHRDPRIWEK